MRFDDSLQTVLAADSSTEAGAALAWRQLVDLIGRGRAPADTVTLERLRQLRGSVPRDIRAASGRAVAFATPPLGLIRLFSEDDPAIAAPVLRMAMLSASEWNALLPDLTPGGRSILRHRRDLPPETVRALAAFGPVDFVLPEPLGSSEPADVTTPADPVVVRFVGSTREPASPAAEILPAPEAIAPPPDEFVAVGAIARELPAVVALRAQTARVAEPRDVERFEIADLVARIDAFQRGEGPGVGSFDQAELFDLPTLPSLMFRFESDVDGLIRWVEGADRAAIIGLELARPAKSGDAGFDGAVAGAFRRRAAFQDGRLVIDGRSPVAGPWRVSGVPQFDRASGRFSGYLATARRPRRDEVAEGTASAFTTFGAESMRQLVHELRTPINAIAGFAQMIEAEMLGPVAPDYRGFANDIRGQADALLSGIDDLDMAARAESGTLELRPVAIGVAELLRRVAADLQPLAELHHTALSISCEPDLAVIADERAAERLIVRLLATLLTAAAPGAIVAVVARTHGDEAVLTCSGFGDVAEGSNDTILFGDVAEGSNDTILRGVAAGGASGVSLLGADFALRLAANLAREQGGRLVIGQDSLTLRLPVAVNDGMEQVTAR